jgi:parallel beta-helix repeat protein
MTTYYVSSEIGSNNNAGTSATAPLASLQAAANVVKPGDTVQVMNGTYTAPFYADALDITTSGTANSPITFEAAPGQTPVIDSSGGWNAINIEASYIVVKGFTVVGDAASYTLQSALAGYSTGSSSLDGNGIGINPGGGASVPNHITIEDNTVYNEPGGGIYTEGADYVQILNNVVHNNANWAAFGNSGISVSNSANSDAQSGVHDIISGNLVYDNAQLVPTNGAGVVTDGEGIILDTNPKYTSEMLVENNTVYGNGGPGIESFLTNGAVITGNTVYGNDTQSTQAQNVAEIFINQSNDTVTNNDTANPNVTVPTISQGVLNANDSVTLTGTAIAGSTVTVSDGGTSALGTTVASGSGSWSFTTLILAAGHPSFTATDTISIGTSAASNTLSLTVPTNAANSQTPAAPVISTITENSNESITLTGTAVANSTVTVWGTTGTNDGTATASSSGAWSFTTPVLNSGVYGYYATDTTPGGTSAESNALGTQVVSDPVNTAPAAPVISAGAVNSNDSVTLTGTAPDGATVTVSDGGANPLGTATASGTGAWSFTSADMSAGAYAFTATDKTSAGTSAVSTPLDVTVPATAPTGPVPAAPTIPYGVVNSNDSVTLTGTAPAGATVTVSDGGAKPLGTATANSSFVWRFTTADLSAGAYAFTATDTTSAGTSAVSGALDVTVPAATAPTGPLPAAPIITKIVVNSNDSVTLTGTAAGSSTVTVWSTTGTNDGTATASSTGAWSFTTPDLLPGIYGYTATDTTAAGTSIKSNALGVTVPAAGPPTAPVPGAPVITKIAVNSNDSVTLTGTALANSTVTVWSTTGTNDGTTTASSTGAWSFTTPVLLPSVYGYTATDTTAAGTSPQSNALGVTVPAAIGTVVHDALEVAPAEALPAAPSLTNIAVNSNDSVTLTGTAADSSTVTVWSTTGNNDGTTTANSAGAWSFTTPVLLPSVYGYTANDTTAAGTSAPSNALGVTVPTQSFSANGSQYGEEINLTATSDELDLTAGGLTITRGSGTESLTAGSSVFPYSSSDYRSTETIDAQPGDHFVFNGQFGHETIQGFNALGSDADTLQLSVSSFSYLNAGMSQSSDLAALLMHSTSGTSSTTITDSSGDTLTLAGLSHSTIAADAAANPSLFKFV